MIHKINTRRVFIFAKNKGTSTHDVSVDDGPQPVDVHVLQQLLRVLDRARLLHLDAVHRGLLQRQRLPGQRQADGDLEPMFRFYKYFGSDLLKLLLLENFDHNIGF
jgi:hypothetical protein